MICRYETNFIHSGYFPTSANTFYMLAFLCRNVGRVKLQIHSEATDVASSYDMWCPPFLLLFLPIIFYTICFLNAFYLIEPLLVPYIFCAFNLVLVFVLLFLSLFLDTLNYWINIQILLIDVNRTIGNIKYIHV